MHTRTATISSALSSRGVPARRCLCRTLAAGAGADPCSINSSYQPKSTETSVAHNVAGAISRRQAVGAPLLSGIALVVGSATVLAPSPASAKVSIASIKPGGEGERDIEVTASGIRMSRVSGGHGDAPASGTLVLVDVVASLEDGTVFLDTRGQGGSPLAFQLGTTNKYVTEGLSQVVETMRGGDVKLAVVPPSLGYGSSGVTFKSGARVPPNAPLFYEVSLLRCQELTMGLACCADADFPCIKQQPGGGVIDFTAGAAAP